MTLNELIATYDTDDLNPNDQMVFIVDARAFEIDDIADADGTHIFIYLRRKDDN